MNLAAYRRMAHRCGVLPTAQHMKKQGFSCTTAMRVLAGVRHIPTLHRRATGWERFKIWLGQ